MKITQTLKIAYQALKIHKIRTALTVLGLTIGVMAIIIVMNIGRGFENFIGSQLDVFGTDYINIEPAVPKTSRASQSRQSEITTLKIKDAEAVAKHPNVRDYYVGAIGQKIANYQDKNKAAMLFGISASGFELYGPKIEFGRPFSDEEDKSLSNVIVLGRGIKEDLFGNLDPLEKRIKLGGRTFKVIGVMEEQGNMGFFDMNDMIFVPVRTLQKKIMGTDHIQFILAYLKDTKRADTTAADLKAIMLDQHDISDFDKADFMVTTTEEMSAMLNTITGAVNLLLLAIAGISLVVGGVGIMNIMYVSVSERTYEIGLRKAVGANNSHILWQFLSEAVFLTFSSGIVGVILGSLFTLLAMSIAKSFGFDFGNIVAIEGIILGVCFSVAVGLIFGITPARKAARMQPVEALRHE